MARCATCGALLGPDAEWCGQCYALVRSPRPGTSRPSPDPDPAPDVEISPNGDATTPPAQEPWQAPRPALAAAAAIAAIPPDLQITLASGSRGTPMGDSTKRWITALIVVVAAASDALFFPH